MLIKPACHAARKNLMLFCWKNRIAPTKRGITWKPEGKPVGAEASPGEPIERADRRRVKIYIMLLAAPWNFHHPMALALWTYECVDIIMTQADRRDWGRDTWWCTACTEIPRDDLALEKHGESEERVHQIGLPLQIRLFTLRNKTVALPCSSLLVASPFFSPQFYFLSISIFFSRSSMLTYLCKVIEYYILREGPFNFCIWHNIWIDKSV